MNFQALWNRAMVKSSYNNYKKYTLPNPGIRYPSTQTKSLYPTIRHISTLYSWQRNRTKWRKFLQHVLFDIRKTTWKGLPFNFEEVELRPNKSIRVWPATMEEGNGHYKKSLQTSLLNYNNTLQWQRLWVRTPPESWAHMPLIFSQNSGKYRPTYSTHTYQGVKAKTNRLQNISSILKSFKKKIV